MSESTSWRIFDFQSKIRYSFINMDNIEGPKNYSEEGELSEERIVEIALNEGKIKKDEVYYHRFRTVKSYSGEGIVEVDGKRYKVIGHPLEKSQGGMVKEGWVQVYKMREWQEQL